MTQYISDLGQIGTPSAILGPFDLPLERNGTTWVLTGYTNPTIEVWDLRTRTTLASPGSLSIEDAANGVVRWTPNHSANWISGVYEARVKLSPDGGTTFEPSGLFRFALGADSVAP